MGKAARHPNTARRGGSGRTDPVSRSASSTGRSGGRVTGRNRLTNREAASRRRGLQRDAELVRDRVRLLRARLRRGADVPEYLLSYLGHCQHQGTPKGRPRGPGTRRYIPPGTGMRALRPVAWTALAPGVVVDAWVPFTDRSGYKRRPAVVAGVENGRVRLFPITSRTRRVERSSPRGMIIEDRRTAGLRPEPSAVLWKPVVVERTELLQVIGALTGADLARFRAHAGHPTPAVHPQRGGRPTPAWFAMLMQREPRALPAIS